MTFDLMMVEAGPVTQLPALACRLSHCTLLHCSAEQGADRMTMSDQQLPSKSGRNDGNDCIGRRCKIHCSGEHVHICTTAQCLVSPALCIVYALLMSLTTAKRLSTFAGRDFLIDPYVFLS